ncbi:uncharacterized protein LOC131625257 [Vicia villosa]|uniref:uncharacterized protein LOC131625257 n=1 Tax=Vicia villosa TaxID=3911 RepID=UPI00273C98E7|nr:uncharacterized protein LOC131625257 [Vicia villosa]
MTAKFDYNVVSIEESKNLPEMKLEELQASPEAHEKQRNSEREKVIEQYAYAGVNDFDDVLLMENTQSSNGKNNMWYLDSRCSNHVTGNKTWFTKLDESIKKVIGKDGRKANITNVLYLPSMTSNLISIGQLLAKEYNIKVEKKLMWVYDGNESLIMKTPLTENKTFKVEINTVDHMCLSSTIVEDTN